MREPLNERWYGTVARPICAYCNTGNANPILATDAEVRSQVLANLSHRVLKECTAAKTMIPSSISARQQTSWHSSLRAQAGASRDRRQVRDRRHTVAKHNTVAQLWRTLSRIQLQPELAEQFDVCMSCFVF